MSSSSEEIVRQVRSQGVSLAGAFLSDHKPVNVATLAPSDSPSTLQPYQNTYTLQISFGYLLLSTFPTLTGASTVRDLDMLRATVKVRKSVRAAALQVTMPRLFQ